MKYKTPSNYKPDIPTTEEEAYNYNMWWLNHVTKSKKDHTQGKQKSTRVLTDKQKADRRRFFITQAQKNKDPEYGIPIKKHHQALFKNHQGNQASKGGGKAKQKTKHIDSDPEEGPAPKQAKTNQVEDPEILEKVMAEENDIPMPENNDGIDTYSAGGAMGSRMGSAGGVGQSTTNWNCDTIWGEKNCTTYASRHCVCLMRDNDQYLLIGNTTNTQQLSQENKTAWAAFSTPWNYLDFNQYCIHFSPRDWQHLVNNYARWRPRRIDIKIGNIQIIQENVTEVGSQFNNDLTGTIQIMADQEGRFPRILYPNQLTLMGPFPNHIYYCPQYAYMTSIYPNNRNEPKGLLTKESAFYCLDESESDMLRTGNEWSSSYVFDPSTRWASNKFSTIPITHRQNPLYDTMQTNSRGDDALRGNFGTWRSPWYPGPNIHLTDTIADDATSTSMPHVAVGPSYVPLNPGMPMYRPEANVDQYLNTFWIPRILSNNEGDPKNTQIGSGDAYKVQVNTEKLYNTNPRSLYYTAQGEGTVTANNWSGCVPGMIWDNRPVTYFDPIWQQFPETDEQFKIISQLGGIPMNKSPGHVFVKITPKPTRAANSLLNEYATFITTVKIEWELEPMETHRWNMRPLTYTTTTDAQFALQMVDSTGNYVIGAQGADFTRLYSSKNVPRTN